MKVVRFKGPHHVDRHVGRRVAERRMGLGYTQKDLAEVLGLTFQQVQKYEKGVNRISASKLFGIAAYFQVDVEYFFEGLDGGAAGRPEVEGGVHAPTRMTVELAMLAPQLSTRQQKLALDLMTSLSAIPDAAELIN